MEAPFAICILNYNGEKLLRQFLPPMMQHTPNNIGKVYVIDNCSTDGSIAYIEKCHPEVSIVQTGQNLGFTGGYNVGLRSIKATYYVLVNSDIEVTENWLQAPLELLQGDQKIAACQPKIRAWRNKDYFEYAGACGGFIDLFGYPFCRGRIFESIEKDDGQYDEPMQIFWASGACMFIKADLFHEAGGFDINFFAHMEEIDLCWRLQRLGYTIYCEPKSVVFHVGGETLSKENPKKTFLNFRNSASMLYKNTTDASIYLKLFIKIGIDIVAAFKLWYDNSFSHFQAVFKAYFAFFGDIKAKRLVKKELKLISTHSADKIYKRPIAWDYYIRKIKYFSSLEKF